MKRWRATGAFLLTLAVLGGPVSGGQGQGKGQGSGERGNGRAAVEQSQRSAKAQRQSAQADRNRGKRAEAAAAQQNAARGQRQAQRDERRAERTAPRADRVEQRSQRADNRGSRVKAQGQERPAERAVQQDVRREQQRAQATARRQAAVDREQARARAQAERKRVERVQAERARVERERVQIRRDREARERAVAMQRAEQRRLRQAQADRVVVRRERAGQVVRPAPVRRDVRVTTGAPMRFRGLDRNGDGLVSRREWRGNEVSFRNHDWNGDGLLAGAEVVPGARRGVAGDTRIVQQPVTDRRVLRNRPQPLWVDTVTRVERLPRLPRLVPVTTGWTFDENRFERRLRVDGFEPVRVVVRQFDLTPIDRALVVERFAFLDADRDRYVSFREWTGPRPLFRQLDDNRDDLLVVSDFDDVRYVDSVRDSDRERYVTFHLLDVDDDGLVAPWEWTGDLDAFFLVDVDDNGAISLSEYLGLVRVQQVPLRTVLRSDLDFDGDGDVTAVEWYGDPLRFARLDIDADGELEPLEAFVGWLFQA